MSRVPWSRSVPGFSVRFRSVMPFHQCVWWNRRKDTRIGLRGFSRGLAIVATLVPDAGLGDLADNGQVPRLAHHLPARIGESPLADVDGEAEKGDERPPRHVGIVVVAPDVGAGLPDQPTHHPGRNVAAMARVDVAEHLEL